MSSCASHCMLPGPPPETDADEAHALLDQPAREQAAAAVVVRRLLCRCRTSQRVASVSFERSKTAGRFGLHLEREVVGVDARFEFGVVRLSYRLRSSPLIRPSVLRRWSSDDALRQIEVQHRLRARTEHRRLIDRRQEAVGVHRLAGFERALRIGHHDVGRQRIAFPRQARKSPTNPCSGTGMMRPVNN